jgi:hypothetical protein
MLANLLAAASLAFMPPSEPLKGQLQSAIWADLELNAMIGNGNWIASLWYQAGNDATRALHIQELRCGQTSAKLQCAFDLYRDGGPQIVLNEAAPDRLSCVASFTQSNDGLAVLHTPPRKSGHSKTSMRCEATVR